MRGHAIRARRAGRGIGCAAGRAVAAQRVAADAADSAGVVGDRRGVRRVGKIAEGQSRLGIARCSAGSAGRSAAPAAGREFFANPVTARGRAGDGVGHGAGCARATGSAIAARAAGLFDHRAGTVALRDRGGSADCAAGAAALARRAVPAAAADLLVIAIGAAAGRGGLDCRAKAAGRGAAGAAGARHGVAAVTALRICEHFDVVGARREAGRIGSRGRGAAGGAVAAGGVAAACATGREGARGDRAQAGDGLGRRRRGTRGGAGRAAAALATVGSDACVDRAGMGRVRRIVQSQAGRPRAARTRRATVAVAASPARGRHIERQRSAGGDAADLIGERGGSARTAGGTGIAVPAVAPCLVGRCVGVEAVGADIADRGGAARAANLAATIAAGAVPARGIGIRRCGRGDPAGGARHGADRGGAACAAVAASAAAAAVPAGGPRRGQDIGRHAGRSAGGAGAAACGAVAVIVDSARSAVRGRIDREMIGLGRARVGEVQGGAGIAGRAGRRPAKAARTAGGGLGQTDVAAERCAGDSVGERSGRAGAAGRGVAVAAAAAGCNQACARTEAVGARRDTADRAARAGDRAGAPRAAARAARCGKLRVSAAAGCVRFGGARYAAGDRAAHFPAAGSGITAAATAETQAIRGV